MKVSRPQPRPVPPGRPCGGADPASRRRRVRTAILRALPAGLLGAGAAVLVSCGSSGAGLIPADNAEPLVKDFQAVEAAAAKGNGDCTATKAALHTTERDFQSLPASVNAGLRSKLHEGIAHLQTLALELCAQPQSATTTTETGATTTPAPAKSKSTPPTSTGETAGTTGGATTPGATAPGATTPSGGAEGGTSPEAEESGEAGGGAGAGQGGGAAAGGGHEDNGLGNGGESGNGGAGVPGGSEK